MREILAQKKDPYDHGLYICLGDTYKDTNPDQAYLSYENALYHCLRSGDEKNAAAIRSKLDDLRKGGNVSVRKVSFCILSYNTYECTRQCIESIRDTCPPECYEIIVADNASTDESIAWLRRQSDVILIENTTNVGFPAGCNQCIEKASPENDIFLLNNDTILLPNSLFWLRMGLYFDKRNGAAGSVTNCAGNGQQIDDRFDTIDEYIRFGKSINVPMDDPYEIKSFLIMFAMLIKRDALNAVGVLDELFTPGNFEDNDYGIRLMENRYYCILCHNSYIFHHGSKSFGKDVDRYMNLYMTNREKFRDKWGFYTDRYIRNSDDILPLIDEPHDRSFKLLEIGCGLGDTLAKIKYAYPLSELSGTESNKRIATLAGNRFDIRGADPVSLFSGNKRYDYILISDLPEDTADPESALLALNNALTANSYVLSGTTEDAILWRDGR